MPLYRCAVSPGLASYEQRSRIAKEVARIHCEVTDGLAMFVHAFFAEGRDVKLQPEKRAFLLGSIRAVPARWVMEGGDVLPEPGEKTAWLEGHGS